MSDTVSNELRSLRERLEQCINDLRTIEGTLPTLFYNETEKPRLTKETLERLPWRPFKSGRGFWVFRDLRNPVAQTLAEMLARNGGNVELHGVQYMFSGPNNKFISRFGGQRM